MNALTSYEAPEADEDELTRKITDILRRKMERDYPAGATKRDAHPKHVALVSAKFIVEPELPANLAIGIFSSPKTYDAWVRLSNANGEPRSDAVKDIRGCAVKLLDVEGVRIPESDEATTQDFLMVSMPTMPLGNVALFHDAVYYSIESTMLLLFAKMILKGKLATLNALAGAKTHPSSPADIRYWSTTPYLLGSDQAGTYVLVVNKDNVVEQRRVEVGPTNDTMRVIEKGLGEADRVVVSGMLRVIPGQKVDPQTQTAAASAPAGGAAH